MKAKELIELLQKEDPEMPVIVTVGEAGWQFDAERVEVKARKAGEKGKSGFAEYFYSKPDDPEQVMTLEVV